MRAVLPKNLFIRLCARIRSMKARPRRAFLGFLDFARLRCDLIAHYVELVRHGQIKRLPGELVAPVCLLIEKVRVLHT